MKMPAARFILRLSLLGAVLLPLLIVVGPCRHDISMNMRYWRRTRSIEFYGKVVDGNGRPVPGAKVTVHLSQFSTGSAATGGFVASNDRQYVTDSDGRFSVSDVNGFGLGISRVEAAGFMSYPREYYQGRDAVGFSYARERGATYYVPDPNSPAVIPLQREDEGPPPLPTRGGREEREPW